MKLIINNTYDCFYNNTYDCFYNYKSTQVTNHTYESPPQWRTIKAKSPCHNSTYYLFFPYMQFQFKTFDNQTYFNIYGSAQPFPSPNITIPLAFINNCLGDNYNPHNYDHAHTISRYWNTTFIFHTQHILISLISLTNLHKNNLWNTTNRFTDVAGTQL